MRCRESYGLPSKSSATMIMLSVGVTDIQTPSVVRMAEPANDVSARWFSAKLFPTDCSPNQESAEDLAHVGIIYP